MSKSPRGQTWSPAATWASATPLLPAPITSVITGADPAVTTGRGAGIEDSALDHKVDVIKRSIEVNKPDASDGLDVLAKVGGFEIGVLAGAMLGTASRRRPVVVDGLISGAAALIAWTMSPTARHYFISSHQSVEPGHQVGLDAMGLRPLLDLGMRLGGGYRRRPGHASGGRRRSLPG